jgi:hypothetical protein
MALSGTSLADVRRFVGLAAIVTWALAGLAAYTAIVLYIGWRVGVVEGAPLGGPFHDNMYRLIYGGTAHVIAVFAHACLPRTGRMVCDH